MLTELKPCPFCGDRLEAWGVNYRHSTDSECVLAHIRVTPTDIDAWNRRVISASPAEGREIVAWRHKWTNSEESGWGYYSAGPQADKLRLGLPGILGRDSGRENWEPLCLATAPTMSEADAKDATRYRWLRAQHEMKEEFEDAEGFVVRETVADAWTVFRPGSVTSLEPVGCIPGELDAAIDAEIERIDRAAAKGESDE